MKDWALVLPGTFPRLAPHTGALHALHLAHKRGDLIKEPSYIVTSSVGFIPGSIAIERSEEKFHTIEEMLINLRRKHFVSLNPNLKKTGAIDLAGITALLGMAYKAGRLSEKNPYVGKLIMAMAGAGAFKMTKKAIKDIFTTDSFLSYDRLFSLLMGLFDFDAIFNSPIKIEAPAVNINKAGWSLSEILSDPPLYLNGWQNNGWVSVTNFKPEDRDLETKERNIRYAGRGINGMRVYGHFRPGRHDNDKDSIVDTAAMSNLPIHFALRQGLTNIVVLHYDSRAEGPTDRVFKTWPEHLNRDFDINVSENTRKAICGYLRMNNDLAELEMQKVNLKKLEQLLYGLDVHSPGQTVIRQFIRDQERYFRNLSYAHKQKINFIFAGAGEEPIPDAHFSDFTQNQIITGINIGYRVGENLVPQINKMIS